MSSSRFEAFSEVGGPVEGEDACRAFASYLRERGRGQRISPVRVARDLNLDEEIIDEMIAIATSTAVGLLTPAFQVRCPQCHERIDRETLLLAERVDGEACCPECDRRIERPEALAVEARYRLSVQADGEAEEAQQTARAKPVMRAVLLCALLVELEALEAQLREQGSVGEQTIGGGDVFKTGRLTGEHVSWELFVGCSERSNPASAASAANAIATLKPQVAMFVGVAGGIAGKIELGEVVAATTVFDYDQGKDTDAGYQAREVQLHSTFALRQRAMHVAASPNLWTKRIAPPETNQPAAIRALVEPIAAGGKVVTSSQSETAQLIAQSAPRAVAVETEGAGFLTAIDHATGVSGIVIRGISDMRDGKAASDREHWQARAAVRAAAFAFELLHRLQQPGL
jgi:nucleoside phosphorylase